MMMLIVEGYWLNSNSSTIAMGCIKPLQTAHPLVPVPSLPNFQASTPLSRPESRAGTGNHHRSHLHGIRHLLVCSIVEQNHSSCTS